MSLSWQTSDNISTVEDLISSTTTCSVSYSNDEDTILTLSEFYIFNVGNSDGTGDIEDFGIYIKEKVPNQLFPLLTLSSLKDEDDKPYGLYLVFGFNEEHDRYSTLIANNDATIEQLALFHVNWTNGSSISNKITLDRALIKIGTDLYDTRSKLVANSYTLYDFENESRIKVSLIARLPSTYQYINSQISIAATE